MSDLPPLKPRNLLNFDTLLVLPIVLIALTWGVDFVGCRFGYQLGLTRWMFGTIDPLLTGIAVLFALIGAVKLGLRKGGAGYFVMAAALMLLPRLFEAYAPALCAVSPA
jgi:hypothetical protein